MNAAAAAPPGSGRERWRSSQTAHTTSAGAAVNRSSLRWSVTLRGFNSASSHAEPPGCMLRPGVALRSTSLPRQLPLLRCSKHATRTRATQGNREDVDSEGRRAARMRRAVEAVGPALSAAAGGPACDDTVGAPLSPYPQCAPDTARVSAALSRWVGARGRLSGWCYTTTTLGKVHRTGVCSPLLRQTLRLLRPARPTRRCTRLWALRGVASRCVLNALAHHASASEHHS